MTLVVIHIWELPGDYPVFNAVMVNLPLRLENLENSHYPQCFV